MSLTIMLALHIFIILRDIYIICLILKILLEISRVLLMGFERDWDEDADGDFFGILISTRLVNAQWTLPNIILIKDIYMFSTYVPI